MILELDCGNSFIKWRVLASDAVQVVAGGVVGSDEELMLALEATSVQVVACRLVSVRTDAETELLVERINQRYEVACVSAQPVIELAGVRNGYENYQQLGLDRWLALVGAYLQAGKACLVLDLGTAVTADYVSASGEHLGGFICPGVPLMRNQLRTHTRRIRYGDDVAERAQQHSGPGRTTAEAVERGCSLMLQGFVVTQLELARKYLGDEFVVFLTGGDAALAVDMAPGAVIAPDLVFKGLAAACPLS